VKIILVLSGLESKVLNQYIIKAILMNIKTRSKDFGVLMRVGVRTNLNCLWTQTKLMWT